MPKRFFIYSRTQPARMIVLAVSWITFLAGLYIFTPWYQPAIIIPTVAAAFKWPVFIGAIINTLSALPALLAVRNNEPRAIATGAWWLFCWYTFITLSRLILVGNTLLWVPTFIIAVVMAVVYLEQKSHDRIENDWKY